MMKSRVPMLPEVRAAWLAEVAKADNDEFYESESALGDFRKKLTPEERAAHKKEYFKKYRRAHRQQNIDYQRESRRKKKAAQLLEQSSGAKEDLH